MAVSTARSTRSKAGVDYPDIQYHFLPIAVRYDGRAVAEGHGFQTHVGPMRSKSRGSVRLRSRNPADNPVIRFNYMSHPDDWTEFRAASGQSISGQSTSSRPSSATSRPCATTASTGSARSGTAPATSSKDGSRRPMC